jgi:enterochelin esterase family protein
MKPSFSLVSCAAALGVLLALAQAAPAQVTSPEVHPDGSVTFRVRSPNATNVTVSGEFWGAKRFKLEKAPDSTNGLWSVTTPPIEPDIYAYVFNVDGATVIDPVNTFVRVGAWAYMSQVYIPGPRSDFLAVKDVPHGTVHEHWYHNKELNTERRVLVYTPPGYSEKETYPVLYLLHGSSDDEAFWVSVGRANFVMDNLLAGKKAKPALIVMPFGHASRTQPGRGAAPPRGAAGTNTARGGGANFGVAMLENDLKENVIPMVERTYHVGTKSTQRAIAGLSMGGTQSLTIGLNNPDRFAYVAGFSSALRGNNETTFASLIGDPKKANDDYKLIWLGCGDKDGLLDGSKSFDALLTSKSIKHEFVVTPDFAHEWTLWRRYLQNLMPKLFND